jgi:hypothetical protein
VKARVSVIDGPGKPADYPDTLIFPRLLLAQTRDKLGEKVLGRLGKGVAKPGQDAPWVLNEPSETDYQIAEDWLKKQTPADPWAKAEPPF